MPFHKNKSSGGMYRYLPKFRMGQTEFDLDVAAVDDLQSRKGNGIYCSPARIVFTILTVSILIAATALIMFYIPDRSIIQGATKSPSVENPTTKAEVTSTDEVKTAVPPVTLTTTPPTNPTTVSPDSITTDLTTVPQATSSTRAPPDLMKGRLPKTVLPRRYEVNLRPFLYDDDVPDSKLGERFTFDGWVRIKVECIESTNEITIHSKNITIHGMPTVHSVSTLDKTDIFESYKMVDEYAFMVLKLKQMLRPHEEYDIYMEYSGILRDDDLGFYLSKYMDMNITRYIATTQMEGPYARCVLPCFDEPTFKASYDVQLEHPTDMSALSNGIATRHIQLDGHWSRTYFKRVPSMPTYLLAFIVHDFSSISVTNANGCLIRIWCETDLINLAPYALNVSDKVQTFFDDYLDYEFPLDKQDHIAIQDFYYGAMENWGLITYKDIFLLYGMDDFADNTFYSKIITHELAHMWFGNLVTMEWWNDVWLNEGFATYMEHIGVNHVHPEFNKFESFYVDVARVALYSDSLGVFPSIRAPVYATDEDIMYQFNAISYQKGGSILWMMEHFLTLDVFNQGIRNYLKERAYKNANTDQLWHELTYADKDVGKHDVKKIMDTWTLQPGYPLITLTRTGQDVVATQRLFLQINRTAQDEDFGLGYKWYVPLTYVYKSGPADQYDKPEQVWMEPTDYTYFTLPDEAAADDWYLANAKMVGLYRVNYEDDNWQRLLDQAATDPSVFSEENRVGLIYDTQYLAQAEIIPNWIFQNFSSYLGNKSRSTRRAVVSASSYFAKMLGNDKRQSSSAIQTYMQQLVEPLYTESGWDSSFIPDVPFARRRAKKNRIDITSMACLYGNNHCVTKATNLFKEYVDNPQSNTIPPNLRIAVYCNGIRFGWQLEWEFGWNMMQTTSNRQERSRWISALTCSRESSLLKSYLQSVFNTIKFSRVDAELILMGVAENPAGYKVAWDFIRNHWEDVNTMFKRNGQQILTDIFEEITSNFNTQEKLQELLDFGQSRHLGVLKYAYKAAVTSTEVNIRWMANSAHQTEEWVVSVI